MKLLGKIREFIRTKIEETMPYAYYNLGYRVGYERATKAVTELHKALWTESIQHMANKSIKELGEKHLISARVTCVENASNRGKPMYITFTVALMYEDKETIERNRDL